MVKGILIRVGADTSNLGVLGPIFEDGSFEFIPINKKKGTELDKGTYSKIKGRHGGTLADYLPNKFHKWIPHNDPEFSTPSYGDTTTKINSLRKLQKGDLLVFNAGLRAYNTQKYPERANYIVGYFTVDRVVDFTKLRDKKKIKEQRILLKKNEHVGSRREKDSLIVVGQKKKSALFSKAIPFTVMKPDSIGRPTAAINKNWEKILGISGFVQRRIRNIPEIGCKNLIEIFDKQV